MRPSRQELEASRFETLNRGGWGNADVYLSRIAGEPVVVKDFAARAAWLRWTWGVWMNRRELAAYRRLAGMRAVPGVVGEVDAFAFALEYRPGERLSRALAGVVSPDFAAELDAAIGEMHSRGVVHLDLRHRSNVLAGVDGHPVLLDFASSLVFAVGGFAARWILPWLARLDRAAAEKWRRRLDPESDIHRRGLESPRA
jgi:hypothetical protein